MFPFPHILPVKVDITGKCDDSADTECCVDGVQLVWHVHLQLQLVCLCLQLVRITLVGQHHTVHVTCICQHLATSDTTYKKLSSASYQMNISDNTTQHDL